MDVTVGAEASLVFEVLDIDTAESLGSGTVPVLGTPRLLAWLEAATVSALAPFLTPDRTSVGVRVEVDHLAPTQIGERVTVHARVDRADGRRVEFGVRAVDGAGTEAGRGRIVRAIVDRERFLAR